LLRRGRLVESITLGWNVAGIVVLATGYRAGHSVPGIAWTAVTAAVMFALAAGKTRTGAALGNPGLATEGRARW
jgi:hypothetical protein